MIVLSCFHLLLCFSSVLAVKENITTGANRWKSHTVAFPGSNCATGFDERSVIEGVKLVSSNDSKYASDRCTLYFTTRDLHQFKTHRKLMLKFTHYNVTDCSVSLKIFYGSDVTGFPDVNLGCTSHLPSPFYSGSKQIILRLDKQNVTGYDFGIVITAFTENWSSDRRACGGFECGNSKCIEKSLLCDDVANCFDLFNTDEQYCDDNGTYIGPDSAAFNVSIPWATAVPVIIILIVGSIAYRVFRTYCRRRFNTGNASRGQMLAAQQAEQSGLLAGNAPSGNVISVQQPLYVPGQPGQPSYQPPASMFPPGQAPYPQQTNYPMPQPAYPAQGQAPTPGLQQPQQQVYQPPPQTYPGQTPYQPPPQTYPGQETPYQPPPQTYPGQEAPYQPSPQTYPGQAPYQPPPQAYPGQVSYAQPPNPDQPQGSLPDSKM